LISLAARVVSMFHALGEITQNLFNGAFMGRFDIMLVTDVLMMRKGLYVPIRRIVPPNE